MLSVLVSNHLKRCSLYAATWASTLVACSRPPTSDDLDTSSKSDETTTTASSDASSNDSANESSHTTPAHSSDNSTGSEHSSDVPTASNSDSPDDDTDDNTNDDTHDDGSSSQDDVVWAKSCSAPDVQAALNVAPDGSVVKIPAGTCDWGSAAVTRAAGIVLRGAGKGLTVIQRSAAITTAESFMLSFDCSNGLGIEISDLTMLGNDDLQSDEEKLVDLDNGLQMLACVDFKVHDMEISKFSNAGLTIRGLDSRGVIYNNEFRDNFKCQPDPVSCLGYGVVVYGQGTSDDTWPPLTLGSENAVFIEDNYFYGNRHNVASNNLSRYVVRYNTMVTTMLSRNFGMIDAHGRGGYPPGSRSWEIYHNTLEVDPPNISADGIYLRGGDGVVFNNTIASTIPYAVQLYVENGCEGDYPVLNQTREAYVWGNSSEGVPMRISSGCETYLVEGRDYFLQARPGYVPYAYPHPLR